MRYADLRRRVLGQLATDVEASDSERVLYGIAHITASGDAEGATLDQFLSEGEWPLVEQALGEPEARFAAEIAELRRRLAARGLPPGARAADACGEWP